MQNKNHFNQIPSAEIQRSSFNRSHGNKTAFDAGKLIPILVDEALPGDTFNCRLSAFGRMATPIHPIMDNIYLETFFFAVPNRLLWENWQKFNGEQDNPGDSTDFTVPTLALASGFSPNTVADYMGIPTLVENLRVNSLHFRAYRLIWNEFFRDQNLQESLDINLGNQDTGTENVRLLTRGKRHDYFTSSLPFPQKGEQVLLPLGTVAPVTGLGVLPNQTTISNIGTERETSGSTFPPGEENYDTATSDIRILAQTPDGLPAVYADLSEATASTINELRQAFQIQRMQERDARGGTRYTEILKAHFGVISPDARLQRPEYLGGGQSMVNVNPVAQTQATIIDGEGGGISQAQTPQANLAAYGTVSAQGHGFTKSFTEHCVIIGLVSVRADLTYQQGLDRMFSRRTRYDYYWPALAHLGEQAVLNKEIYAQGTPEDDEVFGYQERHAEYRFKQSQVTSLFRSKALNSLDSWHLAQDFAELPTLGPTFIEENPPIDRVIAVQDEPHFILDCYFNYQCARPMPIYGVPGMVDHF